MKQIPIGFPTELERHGKDQAKANYQSFAAYIRRLVQDDKSRKESTACNNRPIQQP